MCGIVGIYLKSKKFEGSLGNMLSDMLINMGSRGPDSAGFAIYKEDEDVLQKFFKFPIILPHCYLQNVRDFEKNDVRERCKREHWGTKHVSTSETPFGGSGSSCSLPRRACRACPSHCSRRVWSWPWEASR